MSKHRHKSSEESSNEKNESMYNNPFGITPQQLLGLLGGNMDMNGLGNVLSSMGKEGFDLNSLNKDVVSEGNSYNVDDIINKKSDHDHNKRVKDKNYDSDDNMQFLLSLRNIVDSNRIEFIDKIIKLYKDGMI